MKSSGAPIEALRKAVFDLHGGAATWVESVPIKETFQGKTVWEGEVQIFSLAGHPTATRCYAWSHDTDKGKRKFFAVLRQGSVDSPRAAVRAAIVAEFRNSR